MNTEIFQEFRISSAWLIFLDKRYIQLIAQFALTFWDINKIVADDGDLLQVFLSSVDVLVTILDLDCNSVQTIHELILLLNSRLVET